MPFVTYFSLPRYHNHREGVDSGPGAHWPPRRHVRPRRFLPLENSPNVLRYPRFTSRLRLTLAFIPYDRFHGDLRNQVRPCLGFFPRYPCTTVGHQCPGSGSWS